MVSVSESSTFTFKVSSGEMKPLPMSVGTSSQLWIETRIVIPIITWIKLRMRFIKLV